MIDSRLEKLGDTIVYHSCEIKSNDKVIIESSKSCYPLIKHIIKRCYEIGAIPFVMLKESDIQSMLMKNATEEQVNLQAKYESYIMKDMDVYIEIKDDDNMFELSNIPPEKWGLYHSLFYKPVHWDIRLPKTRWVTVRYPSKVFAHKFEMNTDEFEKFYFDIMNLNYNEFGLMMKPLKERLDRGSKVFVEAPGTNLEMSIKPYNAVICNGKINLPDGEVFIAPEVDSINGSITYNTDVLYDDITFSNIHLDLKDGKVIDADAGNHTEELNRILDTDSGARFVGEFAFGTNPYVNRIVKNIIFDEKMLGSIHIALGASHPASDNGNKSGIHWDMVQIHKPQNGGGRVYIDNDLILNNGIYVPDDLKPLNYENSIERIKKYEYKIKENK